MIHLRQLKTRIPQSLMMALLFSGIVLFCAISQFTGGSVALFGNKLPPFCPFQLSTGFDCPGCGITRSLILALHGNFYQSYVMHLWGLPLLILFVWQIPYQLALFAKRQSSLIAWPAKAREWTSRIVVLSLMVPWLLKSVTILYVLYF